ncbi:MAG TPA: HD domain-containing phosphohydrolase [Thermoleophilaceae bacterium]
MARLGIDTRSDLSPAVQEVLEGFAAAAPRPLTDRERRVEAAGAVAFVAAAVAMVALLPFERPFDLPVAVALVLAYALTKRVKFEIGVGFAVATQLVFVPMLFLLPAAAVPLVVLAGVVLGNLPEYLSRRAHPESVVLAPGDCWYAVAPSLVLAVAGLGEPALSDWPILTLALAAQLGFDFLAVTLQDSLGLGIPPSMQPRLMGWVLAVDLTLSPIGFLGAYVAADSPYAFALVLPAAALLGVFARERSSRIAHAVELGRAYRGTTVLLAEMIEADDMYTGQHSHGVVELAAAVAAAMGLEARRRRNVEFGALLHDVGKIAVPKEIVNKRGPLSDAEWRLMATHTIAGQRMLDRVGGVLGEVGGIVRSSHESWDGTGYPDGLAGEAIPLEARIVACCDAFNAMTTDRSYRRAMPRAAALAELRACAGTQFDPAVVAAVAALVENPAVEAERPTGRAVPEWTVPDWAPQPEAT